MKSLFNNRDSGFTLIEMIIYSTLISMLITGFIRYIYQLHFDEIKLHEEIQDAVIR